MVSNRHLNTKWNTSGREFKRQNHFRTAERPSHLAWTHQQRRLEPQPPRAGQRLPATIPGFGQDDSLPPYKVEALGFVSLRSGEHLKIIKSFNETQKPFPTKL